MFQKWLKLGHFGEHCDVIEMFDLGSNQSDRNAKNALEHLSRKHLRTACEFEWIDKKEREETSIFRLLQNNFE